MVARTLLMVTAFVETPIGLMLLVSPALVVAVLSDEDVGTVVHALEAHGELIERGALLSIDEAAKGHTLLHHGDYEHRLAVSPVALARARRRMSCNSTGYTSHDQHLNLPVHS
jgi:hypothetical protein